MSLFKERAGYNARSNTASVPQAPWGTGESIPRHARHVEIAPNATAARLRIHTKFVPDLDRLENVDGRCVEAHRTHNDIFRRRFASRAVHGGTNPLLVRSS